jgi:hypothetical protein
VPRATCGPGALPEDALQGEVTLADRQSGQSQLGFRCNLQLVGQHQGQGAGWQNAWYGNCDYYDTKTASSTPPSPTGNGNLQTSPGTQVIDVSDPAHPVLTTNLDTPALDGPWESLKVNEKRGLLAGVGGFGSDGSGPMYFDLYDVSKDCAHPTELASLPIDLPLGHEGQWAPDGMTYYGSATYTGTYAAIDVSDPHNPKLVTTFHNPTSPLGHGLSISDDGKTAYLVGIGGSSPSCTSDSLSIADVSQIQSRSPAPLVTQTGSLCWPDGSTAQHTIPITYGGRHYLVYVDEGGGTTPLDLTGPAGAARIIEIEDPTNPFIVSKLKLEIQMPANSALQTADTAGNGSFGYEAHYCAVDRENDPTALACGYFQSGIRVFDIRDPAHPSEIAYYNPPAQVSKHGTLNGSEHDGGSTNSQPPNDSTDWCTSQIRFFTAADGTHYLWAQCQDNGFMTLRFTNAAYPLGPAVSVPESPWSITALPLAGLVAVALAERRRRLRYGAQRTSRHEVGTSLRGRIE